MDLVFVRNPYDLDKQLRIDKYVCSSSHMLVNIDETNLMITKSKEVTLILHMTIIDSMKDLRIG